MYGKWKENSGCREGTNMILTKKILKHASCVSVFTRFNADDVGYVQVTKAEVARWMKNIAIEYTRNKDTGEIFIGETAS